MTKINIIVGHKGSGKTTVLEIINFFGFYTVELSNQWKILNELGFNRGEKEGEWSTGVISLVYENLLKRINITPVFMSGFSRPKEIDFLKNNGFDCELIEVYASDDIRYKRIIERSKDFEGNLSPDEFKEKDLRRLGKIEGYKTNDLDGLLNLASHSLDNNSNLKDLIYKVKGILEYKGYLK
jgi:dephospho-CoA kinase